MALTDEGGNNGMVMPVAPMYGGGNAGFGGGFGGDWAWIILLLLLGWGNNGGFGGGFGGNEIYPWMNQANLTSNGFQNQLLNDNISGIRSGIGDVQLALCNGFAGIEAGANARQIADMQTAFAGQTALAQGFNGLQSQLSQCCCDNRLATVQTQNVVQTEGAATRLAIQEQTQAILDKMCQAEIDNLKTANLALQNQVNLQTLAASQTAQTAQLIADNTAQTQYLVNRISPYPIPSWTVANPNTPAV